jgi:hypothetical protein
MPSLSDQAPNSRFIDFLHSYGPVPASDSLCDENVQEAEATFGVAPIATEAARLEDVKAMILAEPGHNVILTGTAGDGKTYHIRRFFEEAFGGPVAGWPGSDGIFSHMLADGRTLCVIRDLSELSDDEKDGELASFAAALLGETSDRIYLIAANDGQLLKYFRDASRSGLPEAARYRQLHGQLATMLRSELEEFEGLNLRLFNLSRTWDAATVERIFDAVLEHEGWDDACAHCPAADGENPCPIQLNRSLMRNVDGTESPFRRRVVQSLRLAAANDQHVPIRQLLTLIVNIVLGDAKNPDQPLLDCEEARKRAGRKHYEFTNPYNNACGLNLRPDRRRANRVFQVFDIFGLGLETNNLVDGMLVQGQPADLYDRLFASEPTYGRQLFEPLLNAYLAGGSESTVKAFRLGLEAQRRRAFFRLPDRADREMETPWRLTIFHHGGEYLDLLSALRDGDGAQISDKYARQMIRGLNRAFTGMMASDQDKLWLAGTIGKTDDPSGRISTVDPISRSGSALLSVRLTLDQTSRRPALVIVPHKNLQPNGPMPPLDLKPLLFEYLMRVANGSLPASFSRQCHQEIRHFALVNMAEVRKIHASDEPGPEIVNVLSLSDQGEIQPSKIEIR